VAALAAAAAAAAAKPAAAAAALEYRAKGLQDQEPLQTPQAVAAVAVAQRVESDHHLVVGRTAAVAAAAPLTQMEPQVVSVQFESFGPVTQEHSHLHA
jgi:hypothetical protein